MWVSWDKFIIDVEASAISTRGEPADPAAVEQFECPTTSELLESETVSLEGHGLIV
jgi:hypothetical protein